MDDLENKVDFEKIQLPKQSRAEDLFGTLNPNQVPQAALIKASATAPTNSDIPQDKFSQFRIYNNGAGTIRLYYYDTISLKWNYINADGQV